MPYFHLSLVSIISFYRSICLLPYFHLSLMAILSFRLIFFLYFPLSIYYTLDYLFVFFLISVCPFSFYIFSTFHLILCVSIFLKYFVFLLQGIVVIFSLSVCLWVHHHSIHCILSSSNVSFSLSPFCFFFLLSTLQTIVWQPINWFSMS